jgi:hypothetical protein
MHQCTGTARAFLHWCIGAFLLLSAVTARAQPPDVDAVLEKAADYISSYKRDFVGIVAEETYRQTVTGLPERRDARGFPVDGVRQRRDLKSDILYVRTPDGDRWLQFRDVFEVDRKPVRDRAERLAKLFLQPSRSVQQQAQDISTESARYNIGGVNRNINLPVLALSVLETESRPWFSFNGARKKDVWEIEFREERGSTLIRTNDAQSMPSHGRFTIEAATGRVLSSDLIAESARLRARIEVQYAPDAQMGLLVPREMREKYESKDGSVIEGRASYAKFRRYQVTTDEKLGTVKK